MDKAWRLSGKHVRQIIMRAGDDGMRVVVAVDTETTVYWSMGERKPPDPHPVPSPLPTEYESETVPNGGCIALRAKLVWVERSSANADEISGTLSVV